MHRQDSMDSRDDMKQHVVDIIAKLKTKIENSQDLRVKEVGDRVKIWDGSGNRDKNTDEKRWGIDELFKTEGIIIETGLEVPNITKFDFEPKYMLDILVKFPTGEEVYTMSKFVSRTDNHDE